MTFDISLEAIEADLALADRQPGSALANLSIAKAQIRATLLAAQIASGRQVEFSIDQGSYPTVEQMVGQMKATMRAAIHPSTEEQADAAADVAGVIIYGPTDPVYSVDMTEHQRQVYEKELAQHNNAEAAPDDEDYDFFAEARRERD